MDERYGVMLEDNGLTEEDLEVLAAPLPLTEGHELRVGEVRGNKASWLTYTTEAPVLARLRQVDPAVSIVYRDTIVIPTATIELTHSADIKALAGSIPGLRLTNPGIAEAKVTLNCATIIAVCEITIKGTTVVGIGSATSYTGIPDENTGKAAGTDALKRAGRLLLVGAYLLECPRIETAWSSSWSDRDKFKAEATEQFVAWFMSRFGVSDGPTLEQPSKAKRKPRRVKSGDTTDPASARLFPDNLGAVLTAMLNNPQYGLASAQEAREMLCGALDIDDITQIPSSLTVADAWEALDRLE